MIVYYSFMRVKDENKNDAIFNATIDLLNEIGFSDISMSKIAKRAGVSPSTLYVYFENKDDMLKKTYLYVKNKMLESLEGILDGGMEVEETVALLMRTLLVYLLENRSYFLFAEQFDNSPLLSKLCLKNEADSLMSVYYNYVDRAKAGGVLKQMDTALLMAYCYYPVAFLAKESMAGNESTARALIDQAIELSWQAIKA